MVEAGNNKFVDYRVSVAVYGLMLLILVYIGRIQELVPNLEQFSVGKIVFFASILLLIVSPKGRQYSMTGIVQVKYVIGIYIFAALSIPFSYWPGGSMDFVIQGFIKTVIFFFLIVTIVNNESEINKMVWAITCSVFVLSLTGFISRGGERLSASSTYDPNDFAFVMVTFMPIVYYFMKQKTGIPKILLQATLVMMLIAMLATGSRGGFVGLIVIIVIIFKKQGKNLKQAILPLIVLVVVVSSFASSSFWDRMSTMLNPNKDYNITAGGGRKKIWISGLKMMIRRPLNGVGANAFEVAEGATHTDIATGKSGKWSSAHNSFIQIGAELGIIGLILFVKLLSSSIKCVRKCQVNNGLGSSMAWLLDGTEVAFYGYITCGFFLSQAYSPVLYLLVALVVVIQRLVNHGAPQIV